MEGIRMANVNCLCCRFRHEDNGNCTAVGGFCTAVPAVHCPLLREYLDTELTPDEVSTLVKDWSDLCTIIGECGGIDRLRELAEADKYGRLVVLPCKVGDTVFRDDLKEKIQDSINYLVFIWCCANEEDSVDG
nr:MAG TPA: hypothetical protein [Caudoviricetes sp.]